MADVSSDASSDSGFVADRGDLLRLRSAERVRVLLRDLELSDALLVIDGRVDCDRVLDFFVIEIVVSAVELILVSETVRVWWSEAECVFFSFVTEIVAV